MKKKILTLLLVGTMVICLVACGGKGDEDVVEDVNEIVEEIEETSEEEKDSEFETYEFDFADYFKVSVKDSEIVYDEYYKVDTLVLYASIENTSDEAKTFASVANINAYQHDETLDLMQLRDENDNFLLDYTVGQQETQPGESFDKVFGWQLTDDSLVTVDFGGYTSATDHVECTFDVSNRLTDEFKEMEASEAAELEEKQNDTVVDLDVLHIDLPEGWYVDSSSDSEIVVKNNNNEAQITIKYGFYGAAEMAEALSGNFGGIDISDKDINGVAYKALYPNDSQFLYLTDGSNPEKAIEIYGMFAGESECQDFIDAIEIIK